MQQVNRKFDLKGQSMGFAHKQLIKKNTEKLVTSGNFYEMKTN